MVKYVGTLERRLESTEQDHELLKKCLLNTVEVKVRDSPEFH
jgi:hypothetical protein